jgi:fumarate hydratase class II
VNKSQSSNDTYPTAMHIAAYTKVVKATLPALEKLRNTLDEKAKKFQNIVKIGRTHLMDATPLTLDRNFRLCCAVGLCKKAINNTLDHLKELALGGTAVGTGLNTPKGYDVLVAKYIADFTGFLL